MSNIIPRKVVEASEIGFPPGVWPKHDFKLGWIVDIKRNVDGDVLYVDYQNAFGKVTRVLND